MVASLFAASDKGSWLTLAWSDSWTRATRGDRGSVGLAEDSQDKAALEDLYKQADRKQSPIRPSSAARRQPEKQGRAARQKDLPPRKLKTLDQLTGKTVERLGVGAAHGSGRRGRRGLRSDVPRGRSIGDRAGYASLSAPLAYSDEEKEELALSILQLAVNGESTELRDYRHLRGVGADAIDKLRRYFEIKSFYGPLPDQVDLTANEAERAFLEGDKFFLAVVAGLEEGYDTVVRIFSNPLRVLGRKWPTSTTLEGITRRPEAGFEVRWPDTLT